MKKNNVIASFFMISILFFCLIANSIHTKAVTNEPFTGDHIQAGRLRFGMMRSQINSGDFGELTNSTPTVRYVQSDNNIIEHLFAIEDEYDAMTTSPLNIIETIDEYQNNPTDSLSGITEFKYGGKKKEDARIIEAQGEKYGSDDFDIKLELEANRTNTSIKHTFTITNKSKAIKTIYPAKQVDTELAGNDFVPIGSRGPHKGLYIEAKQQGSEDVYRLDYITDIENGPSHYKGAHQSSTFSKVFGSNLDSPVSNIPQTEANVEEAQEGRIVYGNGVLESGDKPEDQDTGIFMLWDKKTLKPGQTATISYAVGISPATKMKIDKTVSNKTSTVGTHRAGDELEYSVTLQNSADAGNGLVQDVRLLDKLPSEVDVPISVELIDAKGNQKQQSITDVYKSDTHEIDLNIDDMLGQEVVKLKYRVKIKNEASGKMIVNAARATGQNPNGGLFEIDASIETPILAVGKVTIRYEDEQNNELAKPKVIEGVIGDPYEASDNGIFGYKYKRTEGSAEGEFKPVDQIVTFVYQPRTMYKLTQSVTNASGENVDKQGIALDEVLTYKTTLIPYQDFLTIKEKKSIYKEITIRKKIDPNLIDIKDITLQTSDGRDIGTINYNRDTQEVILTVSEADNVPITTTVELVFKGKVKKKLSMGTVVKQKAESNVIYILDEKLKAPAVSNEVVSTVNRGELLIISAPKLINFGEAKIKDYDKVVSSTFDKSLIVKDTMKDQDWKVTIKLVEEMTNNDAAESITLPDSLYIRYGKQKNPLILNNETLVYQSNLENEPEDKEEFNISDSWGQKENEDGIKFKASKIPQSGKYQGRVEWSVANTQ